MSGIALRIDRVVFLVQPFISGFARVDRLAVAPRARGAAARPIAAFRKALIEALREPDSLREP